MIFTPVYYGYVFNDTGNLFVLLHQDKHTGNYPDGNDFLVGIGEVTEWILVIMEGKHQN